MKMRNEKGFTLIEIVMVIILLGILAAVAIPRFIDMSAEAKKSATKGVLGGVRGGIAIEYANKALRGSAGYPKTVTELKAVMDQGIPANPFNNSTTVTITSSAPPAGNGKGWMYGNYTTAATKGKFWSAVGGSGVGANKW